MYKFFIIEDEWEKVLFEKHNKHLTHKELRELFKLEKNKLYRVLDTKQDLVFFIEIDSDGNFIFF